MNIKSIAPNVVPIENSQKGEQVKNVKTGETSKDREGNGRRDPDENSQKRELTEEELQSVLEHIRALPGVRSSSLTVRLVTTDTSKYVLVEAPDGKTVRRIPEQDLWVFLNLDQDKKTGQIYDKAL